MHATPKTQLGWRHDKEDALTKTERERKVFLRLEVPPDDFNIDEEAKSLGYLFPSSHVDTQMDTYESIPPAPPPWHASMDPYLDILYMYVCMCV